MRVARPSGTIAGFIHALDGKVRLTKPLSLEDMGGIIAAGWAGALRDE